MKNTKSVITPEIINMLITLQQDAEKVRTAVLAIEREMDVNDNQYDEISYICNMLNDNIGYMGRVIEILPTK